MVGVVTQEIQDIIGSPIVKEAIINNSDVFMLLDQSKFKDKFDDIKATTMTITTPSMRNIGIRSFVDASSPFRSASSFL